MQTNSGIICTVFDLDGTLIQSHSNIYKATIKAFDDLKIEYSMPENDFYKYIGHHFEDIFYSFGINVPDFDIFLNRYKQIYFDFIDHSSFYSGVEKVMQFLKEKNIKVALLTTKGQDQAVKILTHFKIDYYFDEIMGRRPGIAHKPSPEPLRLICETLKVDASNTLMIGDSELDIQCGKSAGAKTCAVTYGYRTKELLKKENPDYLIDDLNELINLI